VKPGDFVKVSRGFCGEVKEIEHDSKGPVIVIRTWTQGRYDGGLRSARPGECTVVPAGKKPQAIREYDAIRLRSKIEAARNALNEARNVADDLRSRFPGELRRITAALVELG
jgi:hypothetical protein